MTIEKAYMNTIERERLIRHTMNFDSSVDKWIVLWEHEYNEKFDIFKEKLGDTIHDLPGKMNPRDAVKGGRTEVFHMHVDVKDPNKWKIRYLDVNSLYPFVMSITEFPVGHPMIQCGNHSCTNLLNDLKRRGEKFIGVCMVRALAPKDLMVLYLPHKMDGKLMFFLCRSCSYEVLFNVCLVCILALKEAGLTLIFSIDMDGAINVGYCVLEYYELWHYPKGGNKFFKDFILNIVRRKIECSGFHASCKSVQEKQNYVTELFSKSFVNTTMDKIKSDPADRYLNKIMANSVWGKWTQNPASHQEIKTCSNICEYHECLYSGRVKRVSLISKKLLQVKMKLDHQIDGENREKENNRGGLGGKNPIIGAFVTAASRHLMYFRYFSKLKPEQLLYTDTDSVIVYFDEDADGHIDLPTSDLLGDLKVIFCY